MQRIELRGRIVMAGLIKAHVHTSQQLGRGLADGVDLLAWLRDRIGPYESSLDGEDSYICSLLWGIEQIRSGVTGFAEAGAQFVDAMGRAVGELGLRAILVRSTMDSGAGLPARWHKSTDEALGHQVEALERWHHRADDRLRAWFGLRTIFNASDARILPPKELADRARVGIHMHVAEIEGEVRYARAGRGDTTVTHLNRLGVLVKNLLAVHSVWLTDDERQMYASQDVKVAHCRECWVKCVGKGVGPFGGLVALGMGLSGPILGSSGVCTGPYRPVFPATGRAKAG